MRRLYCPGLSLSEGRLGCRIYEGIELNKQSCSDVIIKERKKYKCELLERYNNNKGLIKKVSFLSKNKNELECVYIEQLNLLKKLAEK